MTVQDTDCMMRASDIDLSLERDLFLRKLLRELAGTLEDIVGLDEAEGYISSVGAAIGKMLDDSYRKGFSAERLTRAQVADVLQDLKRRIKGGFKLEDFTPERIVYSNSACPFAEMVVGRRSLCQMTSNVFGHITAQNLGYAKIELKETIANGDGRCIVVVHLNQSEEANAAIGREYYKSN